MTRRELIRRLAIGVAASDMLFKALTSTRTVGFTATEARELYKELTHGYVYSMSFRINKEILEDDSMYGHSQDAIKYLTENMTKTLETDFYEFTGMDRG
jgi:hypothetical protein